MNQWEVLEIFEKEGAVQQGHFLLASGMHSDKYVQCARVLQHPHLAESLADELAGRFAGEEVDVVVCPALGGIVIAYMVALAMHKRMIFAERVEDDFALRRGQFLDAGERALIVEDVITTGGSVQELMALVQESGANVAGLGALIERGADRDFGVVKNVLVRLETSAWDAEQCPLCREGVKLEAPGSRRKA